MRERFAERWKGTCRSWFVKRLFIYGVAVLIIVTYDVSTETKAGRRRLRRVAKVCESTGQRVQKSVFECQVNLMQYEELERRLLSEIDEKEDNLRVYRLTEPAEIHVKQFGAFKSVDFEGPLVA